MLETETETQSDRQTAIGAMAATQTPTATGRHLRPEAATALKLRAAALKEEVAAAECEASFVRLVVPPPSNSLRSSVLARLTRHHKPGFKEHIAEIIPTSLPELPKQPMDLRNNQTSLNTYPIPYYIYVLHTVLS